MIRILSFFSVDYYENLGMAGMRIMWSEGERCPSKPVVPNIFGIIT